MKLRFYLTLFAAVLGSAAEVSEPVTFYKDVLPILQKNCQSCHRPGNIAPMSFLTYDSTRPWAKAMKAAVAMRKMPPWFADPQYGHFTNDPSLKPSDIEVISKWANNGAPQGDAKDAPPPIQWAENGWTTQPDVILKGLPYTVPAAPKNNVIEWMTLITPSGFTKDTWVTSIEIRPGNRAVVHHADVFIVPHRKDVKYGVPEFSTTRRDADVPPRLPPSSCPAPSDRAP